MHRYLWLICRADQSNGRHHQAHHRHRGERNQTEALHHRHARLRRCCQQHSKVSGHVKTTSHCCSPNKNINKHLNVQDLTCKKLHQSHIYTNVISLKHIFTRLQKHRILASNFGQISSFVVRQN